MQWRYSLGFLFSVFTGLAIGLGLLVNLLPIYLELPPFKLLLIACGAALGIMALLSIWLGTK